MRRVGGVIAVFAALVVTNGAAGVLVLARGLAGMAAPTSLAAAAALLGALWLGVVGILRAAGQEPATTGLRPGPRTVVGALAGSAGGATAAAAFVGLAAATGAATLDDGGRSVPPGLLAAGLALNAAFQDLGLFALGRMAGGGPLGWGFAVALFTALHLAESTAPVYVANVVLFGALLVALSGVGRSPDVGLPMGVHGGVNAALVLLGALPGTDEVAVTTLRTTSPWWGGAEGVEGGLAWTALLAGVLAAVSARSVPGGGGVSRRQG